MRVVPLLIIILQHTPVSKAKAGQAFLPCLPWEDEEREEGAGSAQRSLAPGASHPDGGAAAFRCSTVGVKRAPILAVQICIPPPPP